MKTWRCIVSVSLVHVHEHKYIDGELGETHKPLYKTHRQGRHIRRPSEYPQRHQRVPGEPLLAVYEQQRKQTPEHDQTDHLWRVPRERDPSEIQPQEQHQRQAQDREAPEPVDRLGTLDHLRPRVVHVQEEQEEDEGEPRDGQVEPVGPPPGDVLRECASEDGADAAGDRPHELEEGEVEAAAPVTLSVYLPWTLVGVRWDSVPHAEQVRHGDRHQLDEPAARGPLQSTSRDQHLHVDRTGADDGAAEEQGHGQQQDRFPAPDVRELGPDGCRGCIGEQVCASDPGVAGRRVQLGRDCGRRGGHDGLVEGGYE